MTPDRLKERLGEIPTPPAVQARERAVAEARAAIAERGQQVELAREWRPRLLSLVAAVLLVVIVLLTPPGRAASAWVGDLVGIGDVGGPPTEDRRAFTVKDTAVVIDNGEAPDGSRYEWVAYRCKVGPEHGAEPEFEGIGVSLDWPGVRPYEGGGSCEGLEGRPQPGAFNQHGVHVLPSQMKGVAEPDLVISGVTGPDVYRVSVIYTDGQGEKHELPVDFVRVEGKLSEQASRPEPLGTFIAFVPGEWAARDELESRLDLRALYGTGKLKLGPIGRREVEQAHKAFEACPPSPQEPSSEADCLKGRLPKGPFEYVAYDENGREIGRMNETLVPAMVRPTDTIEAEGREEPGDKRMPRRPESGSSGATVLMSGRSPDGALFEFFVERSDYGTCTVTWFPYAPANGVGGCGDGIPPSAAFGLRNPERTFARNYASLTDAPEATTYRVLNGFARPKVARVQVIYLDRDGDRHDAPVKLVQVAGPVLEKIKATEPFGWWVAFVPRSAGHRPIEIIAYGGDGHRLGTPHKLRNP